MKKFPGPQPLNKPASEDSLELPVSDFHSVPPTIDPQTMFRRIEENMPWRSTRPGEKERRAAQCVTVEFVL